MDFKVEQRFDAAAAEVLAVYADPAFYAALGGGDRIGPPEVLDRDEQGDVVTLRVRYRFVAELPDAAARFVEADKLTWVEHTEFDRSALLARSTLTADHYDSLLSASAAWSFRGTDAASVDAAPSTLTVTGDVGIAVPLLGRKVEGAIVEGLEEHLDRAHRVATTRLT